MSDYIHDTDAVIELHNLIRQLGPLQYAWMAKPQPNADAITESLHKITNLLVNHVSTSPYLMLIISLTDVIRCVLSTAR